MAIDTIDVSGPIMYQKGVINIKKI